MRNFLATFPGFAFGKVTTKLLLLLSGLAFASTAWSESSWLRGRIVNITSGPGGLYVILDTGLPDNCAGTPYGWMLIPDSARTMVAVTLLAKIQSNPVVVYTNGKDASGYCIVNQVDPDN